MTRLSIPLQLLLLSLLHDHTLSFPILPRRDFLAHLPPAIAMSTTTTTTAASDTSNRAKEAVKWGIVGLGDVTQIKSGPPFWKCHGSELVAVMRRTPGKAQEFAQMQVPGGSGKCVGYENLQEFLEHPGLQAVYVCTRPGTHLEIAKQVAAANKACYIEKPVGRCAAETQQMKELFDEKGLSFYTAYISRAYDRTQVLKQLLSDGIIGDEITHISYELVGTGGARDMDEELPWRLDAKQSGGGLIMDVGCHVLDRIDYLCGPLINVQGQAENRNSPNIPVEDYVHLTAEIGSTPPSSFSFNKGYAVGAKVECTWDFASNLEPRDELIFTGTRGSIHLAGMSPAGSIEVRDKNGKTIQETTFGIPEHTAQGLIQAVTDDLRGFPKKDIISRGENALRTSRVLDTVLSSYYGEREIGYWDRIDSWPGKPAATVSKQLS
jgi:1,5-anhydro-D-fructose reductase (1,5-anhydro-D-mannitol-forming)